MTTDPDLADKEELEINAEAPSAPPAKPWYLYVLKCADDTLYTGITTDIERRIWEHNHDQRGAKYTRSRRPVRLVCSWEKASRAAASSAEWHFKRLSRAQKLCRINQNSDN